MMTTIMALLAAMTTAPSCPTPIGEPVAITIGDSTIEYETFGTSGPASIFSDGTCSESVSGHVAARRLATPDEIMRMNPDHLLLLR